MEKRRGSTSLRKGAQCELSAARTCEVYGNLCIANEEQKQWCSFSDPDWARTKKGWSRSVRIFGVGEKICSHVCR